MNEKKHTGLFRKALSLLLAAAMAVSASGAVFAADDNDSLTQRLEKMEEERNRKENAADGEDWDYDYWSNTSDTEPDEETPSSGTSVSKKKTVSSGSSQTSTVSKKTVSNSSKTPTTTSNLASTIKSWQAKNSDVQAWLKVSGTNIDYPVLQSPKGNNSYYESLGIDKKYSKNGVIWANSGVKFGDSSTISQNTCIFGHNWTNSWRTAYINRAKDVMFAQLVAFKGLDFAKKNQKITYSTMYEDMTFQIFAVFICNSDDMNYVPASFKEKDFTKLISDARDLSFFDYDTTVTKDDKIITLSTCIDAYYKNGVRQTNQRFVVMGKLVKGDAAKKDVTVTANSDAKTPTGMGTRKDK